jgi:hypothetical protein
VYGEVIRVDAETDVGVARCFISTRRSLPRVEVRRSAAGGQKAPGEGPAHQVAPFGSLAGDRARWGKKWGKVPHGFQTIPT